MPERAVVRARALAIGAVPQAKRIDRLRARTAPAAETIGGEIAAHMRKAAPRVQGRTRRVTEGLQRTDPTVRTAPHAGPASSIPACDLPVIVERGQVAGVERRTTAVVVHGQGGDERVWWTRWNPR